MTSMTNPDALVKRLRENGRWYVDNKFNLPLQAADAIESLHARAAAAKADAEACAPYLKDGETPAECIKRNRDDSIALMELLAAERIKVSNYEKTMQVISESGLEEAKALVAAKEQAESLAEENARLRKLVDPEWFYLAGDMSSDRCRFSVAEVIDEDWLWDNRAEGTAVVQIETATRCPDIWALVHFFTNEEKDARESDDEYEIIEFASEAEARAALAALKEKNDG